MARAAPSREAPSTQSDLEAGLYLKLGEYADEPTLNTSEARIILQKTLETRRERGFVPEERDALVKTRDYLEIFAQFKNIAEAQQVEGIINSYGKDLERFEKSQLGNLVPSSAEEAKALIPSLEAKVMEGKVTDENLTDMCKDLQRLRRQAQL